MYFLTVQQNRTHLSIISRHGGVRHTMCLRSGERYSFTSAPQHSVPSSWRCPHHSHMEIGLSQPHAKFARGGGGGGSPWQVTHNVIVYHSEVSSSTCAIARGQCGVLHFGQKSHEWDVPTRPTVCCSSYPTRRYRGPLHPGHPSESAQR